jgi:hypothetical protein
VNLNASAQDTLYSGNGNATGIAVGNSGNLLRLSEEDADQGASIQVYPNPTSGTITVTFLSTTSDKYSVDVVDITGRSVVTFSDNAKEGMNVQEIDLGNLAPGMYMLILRNSDMVESKRIIVR